MPVSQAARADEASAAATAIGEHVRRQPDPEILAALAGALPEVAALHGGAWGEIATYLPGPRRVTGIRLLGDRVEVHIVARSLPLDAAAAVRRCLLPLAAGQPIDVVVADLEGEPLTGRGVAR